MKPVVRILLADDHEVVREGMKALLGPHDDLCVVGEAEDGRAACEKAAELRPDVVVMDLSMPAFNGVQATEELKVCCPGVKVLALTVHEDAGYLHRLLGAGAAGYVLKRAAAGALVQAIRTVAAGGVYLDPLLVQKLVPGRARRKGQGAGPAVELSEREQEVVALVARGLSNKEIAERLSVGVKTVETYKARSLEKLDLRSRADLVRYALQRGWVTGSEAP